MKVDDPGYGEYLNWLYQGDTTFTFPQTLVLRYARLEKEERRLPQVVKDYGKRHLARLKHLDKHPKDNEYLCQNRFTIADIAVAYALYLGSLIGLNEHYASQMLEYLERLQSREAFKRSLALGKELNAFENFPPSHFNLA